MAIAVSQDELLVDLDCKQPENMSGNPGMIAGASDFLRSFRSTTHVFVGALSPILMVTSFLLPITSPSLAAHWPTAKSLSSSTRLPPGPDHFARPFYADQGTFSRRRSRIQRRLVVLSSSFAVWPPTKRLTNSLSEPTNIMRRMQWRMLLGANCFLTLLTASCEGITFGHLIDAGGT